MNETLQHMPIAVCQPSVTSEDLIPTRALDITLLLRHNPEQKWFWYPHMKPDEMLVFKTFDCQKDAKDVSVYRNVFHLSFEDPDAYDDCQPRQSINHRPRISVITNDVSLACNIA